MPKRGLGRGLDALLRETPAQADVGGVAAEGASGGGVERISVEAIRIGPWQPRHTVDTEGLGELTASIKEQGVLQPLLVRRTEEGYELIAGERRLRAAREAGLGEVPAIVMDVTDQQALELALVENLQREDLNPIEEAEGYRVLCETFGLSQEDAARRVGKARATVTNALRLLGLSERVKEMVAAGRLSAGHAKVLLGLGSVKEQEELAGRVVAEGLSVRALERLVTQRSKGRTKRRPVAVDVPMEHLDRLAERLQHRLGTPVHIISSRTAANGRKVRGTIEISYYSPEELDRLMEILGLEEEI